MDTNVCAEGSNHGRDVAITLNCCTLRWWRSDSAHPGRQWMLKAGTTVLLERLNKLLAKVRIIRSFISFHFMSFERCHRIPTTERRLPPRLKIAWADLGRHPHLGRVPIAARPPAENYLRRFEPASDRPPAENYLHRFDPASEHTKSPNN